MIDPPDLSPLVVVEIPTFGDAPADDTVLLQASRQTAPRWRAGATVSGRGRPSSRATSCTAAARTGDRYAAFAVDAIEAVPGVGGSYARCVVLIEASEESGS
ncbi:MAG: hypothetical protein R2697_12030 [Ilumatobacteraceae bacterium]